VKAVNDTVPGKAAVADVTVVISTFNRARYLPEAIKSILAQSSRPARVVVVADGCTDETAQVVGKFSPDVELIELPNGGKARALNHVLPSIQTQYCWFFDDDDSAYPLALEHLLVGLSADPDASFAFGDWDLVETDGPLASAPGKPVVYAMARAPLHEQRWRLFRECTVMMTGALLRTQAVREVGGLNEALIRGQDYDLMVRLAAKKPFAYCHKTVYAWRQHTGPRGSSGRSHSASSRLAVWARSAEPVAAYLRSSLTTSAWTAPSTVVPTDAPQAQERRTALIRRLWALAPKQELEVTVADLIEAFEACPNACLAAEERRLLTEAIGHDFISFRRLRALIRLRKLPRTRAASAALLALARGLWWLQRGDPEWRSRTRLVASSLGLLGAEVAFRALAGNSTS